jgi:hypothetical protein
LETVSAADSKVFVITTVQINHIFNDHLMRL